MPQGTISCCAIYLVRASTNGYVFEALHGSVSRSTTWLKRLLRETINGISNEQ